VNLDLAQVLAAMGDMPGAMEALRTATQGADPEAARLARQALERLGQH
jgi:FimV-like protein